jgi:hypothetical protein
MIIDLFLLSCRLSHYCSDRGSFPEQQTRLVRSCRFQNHGPASLDSSADLPSAMGTFYTNIALIVRGEGLRDAPESERAEQLLIQGSPN